MPYANLEDKRANGQRWRAAHPGYEKTWRAAHPGYYKQWRLEHPDYVKDRVARWRKANREAYRAIMRTWHARKRATDLRFRLLGNLRVRLRQAVRSQRTKKSSSMLTLVGCTLSELISHLEIRFEPGMSWQNYGKWHIDHIRPCASFDLTDPEQQKACFHFTNLQPLWALDNSRKGHRYKNSQ
jgi:hypothetical protein